MSHFPAGKISFHGEKTAVFRNGIKMRRGSGSGKKKNTDLRGSPAFLSQEARDIVFCMKINIWIMKKKRNLIIVRR